MNTHESPASDDGNITKLLGAGSEIAGGALAGALGFLAAGPGGAALGGVVGASAALLLKHIGSEFSERVLAPREKVRVGGVLALVAQEVKSRIDAGEALRGDDFFSANSTGRSDADEVAEAVLLRCQRETEERKLPYLAHLLSHVAFDSTISASFAHQLIKTAEQLSYRQFCLLRLSSECGRVKLRSGNYGDKLNFDAELLQVLCECVDLYSRSLIFFGGQAALGPHDVNPAAMALQGLGVLLFGAMNLASMPSSELDEIVSVLS